MAWRPRAPHVGTRMGRYGLEYRYKCPRCAHKNLWWVPSRGGGKCWTCDEDLDLSKMQGLFRDFSATDSLAELLEELNATAQRRESPVVPQPVPEGESLHWKARYYLERGRPGATDVGDFLRSGGWYDEKEHRIHFPLARILGDESAGSSAVHSMSRTPDADAKDWLFLPKRGDKELYWFNPVGHHSKEVVIVEGPFDVLAPGLLGHAIALCGVKWHEDCWYWLHQALLQQSVSKLYVWLDPDDAGRKASASLVGELRRVVATEEILADAESGDLKHEEAMTILKGYGYGQD